MDIYEIMAIVYNGKGMPEIRHWGGDELDRSEVVMATDGVEWFLAVYVREYNNHGYNEHWRGLSDRYYKKILDDRIVGWMKIPTKKSLDGN